MKFLWKPRQFTRGAGASSRPPCVLLSASVPAPDRDPRFWREAGSRKITALRVIDRRVDDAVQSLTAQLMRTGCALVHGGHPKIMGLIASQLSNWETGEEKPVTIYQSEHFRNDIPPPGRDEMEAAGLATVEWVEYRSLNEVPSGMDKGALMKLAHEHLQSCAVCQKADRLTELHERLLIMRYVMIWQTRPDALICIGGMEGIEEEVRVYQRLCGGPIYAAKSTYGASALLGRASKNGLEDPGSDVILLDRDVEIPNIVTGGRLLETAVNYDGYMWKFVSDVVNRLGVRSQNDSDSATEEGRQLGTGN